MITREFTASVKPKEGGTITVTVRARNSDEAIRRLLQQGYTRVNWIL